jgi:hypothetical protein
VSWLKEYDTTQDGGTVQTIGPGTYEKNPASSGSWTITPINTATQLDDTAIGPELFAQIAAGHLPNPTKDAQGFDRTLYMIDFPPGITLTLQGAASCSAFCGYTNAATNAGVTITYGAFPDMSTGSGCEAKNGMWSCGGSTDPVVATSVVHGAILGNAITSPQLTSGWFNASCGRIGDICANEFGSCGSTSCPAASVGSVTVGGATFYTQTLWSNVRNDCIVQYCTTNGDCAPLTPVCDATHHTCGPCTATADCPQGDTCNVASGACVAPSNSDSGTDGSTRDDGGGNGDGASPLPDSGSAPDGGASSGGDAGSSSGSDAGIGSAADGGGAASGGGGSSSGCGCSVPGLAASSMSAGTGALVGAVLGLSRVRRRRRKQG